MVEIFMVAEKSKNYVVIGVNRGKIKKRCKEVISKYSLALTRKDLFSYIRIPAAFL